MFTSFKFATFRFRKLEQQTKDINGYKRLDYSMVMLWFLAKNAMRQPCNDWYDTINISNCLITCSNFLVAFVTLTNFNLMSVSHSISP